MDDGIKRQRYCTGRRGQSESLNYTPSRIAVIADGFAQSASQSAEPEVYPNRNAETLERCLGQLGYDVRWNVRARRREILIDSTWHELNDRQAADIRNELRRRFKYLGGKGAAPMNFSRDMFFDRLDALLAHREDDPFIEWLEALPEWDGVPRLDGLLVRNFGAADNPLSHWCSRAPFIGAVQRAYVPGAKIDEVPVLIGAQGLGKAAHVRSLLPPEFPEWHGDAIDLSARAKEKAEALQGRVIVELSELSGLRRAEMEAVKSFITRQDDGQHRGAYARCPETAPRRAVFVGTSNDQTPLPNDPSGNRRFVPVVLTHGCRIEVIAEGNHESWWAEALARYEQLETGSLPRDLHQDAAENAERYRDRDDVIEDKIAGWPSDSVEPMTLDELAKRLAFERPPSRAEEMRLSAALRNCGWQRKRDRLPDGRRPWRWHPQS